jgi:hypothetical protein
MDVKTRRAHEQLLEADSGPYAFGASRTDQLVCALSSLGETQLRKKIDGGVCSVTRDDANVYERVRSLANPRPCTRFPNRTHWDCVVGYGADGKLDELP